MAINQFRTQNQTAINTPDGQLVDQLSGKQGEGIVTELHGKFYTQTYRGNVFSASTVVAGLAIPISNTTAPSIMLWNPAGSGKNLVLLRSSFAYASGTSVATPIVWQYLTGAGNTTSTGAPISAFTNQTPVNGLIGGGNASVMRVAMAGTITLGAAQTTPFYTIGGESALVAATAMNPYSWIHDYDGALIVPPGVAIYTVGTAATGALLMQTHHWEEVNI